MTRNQRLKQFVAHKNLTQEKFGESISAKQNQIANWFSGEKIPAQRLVDIIEAYPDLNARWLITGEGEMLEGILIKNEPVKQPGTYGKDALQYVYELATEIANLKNEVISLDSDNRILRKKCGELEQQRSRAG